MNLTAFFEINASKITIKGYAHSWNVGLSQVNVGLELSVRT